MSTRKEEEAVGSCLVSGLIIILCVIAGMLPDVIFGVGVCGPTNKVTATVEKLYVDNSGSSSHYMVATNVGIFEVDNSFWLGVYNSDELYSSLVAGQTYELTTEGNQVNNFMMENYPYISTIRKIP